MGRMAGDVKVKTDLGGRVHVEELVAVGTQLLL